MLNLDIGSGTFLILLDLSAAFDTIDYDVLCDVYSVIWVYVVRHWTFYVRFFKAALNQLLLVEYNLS